MTLPVVGTLSLLDLVLLLVLTLVAVSGWKHGLVRSLLSLGGFVVGGLIGVQLAPWALQAVGVPPVMRAPASLLVVIVVAWLGNGIATTVGHALHRTLRPTPLRALDNAGGTVFNVVAVSIVMWLVASALVTTTGTWRRQVNDSVVITTIDRYTPGAARTWIDRLQGWVDTSGLPRVIAGIGLIPAPPVPEPDAQIGGTPEITLAAASVVRIEGEPVGCEGRRVVGSGFVYAADRIMTNAHVVAGVVRPSVAVPGGRVFPATVVHFDSRADVAVLRVEGLEVRPLPFASAAQDGETGASLGYPGGGDLQAVPSRVRSVVQATGTDIYGNGAVTREIVTLRAEIERGSSGGPLVNASGEVMGMVFAESIDDPETGYALSLGEIRDDAAAGNAGLEPVSVGRCASTQ